MSSTAVQQPPPLLFGQQPPSSPPFSSPQSPADSQHHSQPAMSSPPAHNPEDIDMSTSTTLLPPAGQRHDRDDAVMQDGLTNGMQPGATNNQTHNPANNVAIEVAVVSADEDPMDTSPDNAQSVVLPNGSVEPQAPGPITPSSPAPDGVSQAEAPSGNNSTPSTTENTTNDASQEPPAPADPALQPPPPPPPVEPARTDSESSDVDDEGGQPWHPLPEDHTSPDEAELKEIEATTEYSALDHEHWEKKAFPPLDDPEYTPGESGRMEWLVENYNGTREKPNRELVMKSKPVTIGGHEWQIKFYPKGNDSDYLSVYIECLSVGGKNKAGPGVESSDPRPETTPSPSTVEPSTSKPPEMQHTPLPLVGSTSIPKRKSVAAQVSVVLYNPAEPRVNVVKTCLHRFCASSPDWGWTRFHGPHYDIPNRNRGQRRALLQNDKLAFTGYIRIIEDQTNCLWEHPSAENIWDSFAMTGLQSMTVRDNGGSPDGMVISAIASWLLFKPFRQFLYSFNVPDLEREPFSQPKPLIGAFQKILYLLRTQVQPGTGPVDLGDIEDALEWYGLSERLFKLDVMQVWEYLRTKLEDELRDTPFARIPEDLYGPKRDYTKGVPSYRVPVVGVCSMQEAINQSPDLTAFGSPLPQLLTVELERQAFDPPSRSYVKVLNKVTLDDHISVRGIGYTLYGFVVHKQTLQSYVYQPILRPEGPGSRWYSYSENREGNKVMCLTQRQAVASHEGKDGSGRVTGNDAVAYIVMYVRDDVSPSAFKSETESERWEVPEWVPRELDRQKVCLELPPMPMQTDEDQASQLRNDGNDDKEPEAVEEREFHILNSKVFLQHEGPGYFDVFDPKWQRDMSEVATSITLKATDGCKEIRDKIAATINEVQDPRQVKFWFVDAHQGCFADPHLLSTGKFEYSSGSFNGFADNMKDWNLQRSSGNWECRRVWVHVVPFANLPELPKDPEPVPKIPEQAPVRQAEHDEQMPVLASADDITAAVTAGAEQQPVAQTSWEDTPMSDPDEPEPEPAQTGQTSTTAESPAPPANAIQVGDTAMVEVDAIVRPDPPVVDVVIPNSTAGDTEMGGTQEDAVPPPPPPTDLPVPPPVNILERLQTPPVDAPRPRTPEPRPDEVYFFLKFFNADKQTLEPKGSFIVVKSSRLENTVHKLLGITDNVKLEFWEEEDLVQARPLRRSKSFTSNDLHNAAIVIYSHPRTDEQKNALADRAAFADVPQFLKFRANARNFPSRMNGHFTFNYFSSQYYKGLYVNGHRHGHGSRIYHSGATYEGSFRLGQRHGHGLYTFQNGDTYDGDWVANQQHGSGTFVEATTGNTYTGGWKHDKKFGEGVTHWKSAQETERLCRICWEVEAEAAFYDCGHVVACLGCARQVENCPVCRRRVLSAMKLYYVA